MCDLLRPTELGITYCLVSMTPKIPFPKSISTQLLPSIILQFNDLQSRQHLAYPFFPPPSLHQASTTMSGSVFSETLQSITTTKLTELSKKRKFFKDQKAALHDAARVEVDQKKRVLPIFPSPPIPIFTAGVKLT